VLRHGPRTGALAASIGALIATGGLSSSAWAQEEEEADDEATEEEEESESDDVVIVTGTRIRRDDFSALNSTSVVTADDMRTLGVISVADMVNQLPNNIASVSPEANPDSSWNVGASIANLRGLNSFFGTRTLTMVDSRRFVASNNGGGVDLNFIPSALVGRIETVTGGSSATYGADAMAGVVNIILDNNIENIRVDLGYATTAEGDGDRYNFSFATGAEMLDGRGQLTIGLDYSDQEAIENCLSRAYCRVGRGIFENGDAPGTGLFGFTPPAPYSTRSRNVIFEGEPQWMILEDMHHTNLPEGMLFADGFTTDCGADLTCGAWRFTPDGRDIMPYLDDLTPAQREAVDAEGWTGESPWGDGKSPYASVPLRPETQRGNLFTRFAYELEGGIEMVADLSLGQTQNRVLQKQSRSNMQSFCIRDDNAFLLQGSQLMQDVFAARWMTGLFQPGNTSGLNDWSITCDEPPFLGGSFFDDRVEGRFDFGPGTEVRKDMSEHLDRENNNKGDVMTFTLNANGDMFEGGSWTWDTYWSYGKTETETFVRDWRSDNRLQMAVDSVIDPLTGEVVCRINSSDPSYDKYQADPQIGSSSVEVNVAGPGSDINDKWLTFYRLALAEEFDESELDAQAQIFFDELSSGCVPLNPFGSPDVVPIPADVKAFAFPSIVEFSDITQNIVSVNFSGDLHQGIGAGPLRMAAGLDFREEETINRTGANEIQARDFQTNFGDNWSGVSTNTEAYAELEMPFLRDVPGAEYLMVNLANRRTRNESERLGGRDLVNPIPFTRYFNSWKASMMWQPVEMMRVRLTRSSDTRAPSARELFQTNTGAQQAGGQNELTSPFRVDDPTTSSAETGDQYENIVGGNSRLEPETALTETLGMVFTPVDLVPGLEVAIDYYETTVTGGIETVSSNATVNRCAAEELAQGVPEEDWVYCSNVVFDEPDLAQIQIWDLYGCDYDDDVVPNPNPNGCTLEEATAINPYTNVRSIASSQINVAPFWNRGIDLSMSYNKQLSGGGFISGRVLATRFLEQSVDLGGNRGRTNVAGQTGSNGLNNGFGSFGINYTPTPRIRGNAFMSYNKNAFTISTQVLYTGKGRLNIQDGWISEGESVAFIANGVPQVATYDPTILGTVSAGALPSWTTLNLNFNYDFSRSRFQFDRFESLSVYMDVDNAGDRIPDFFSGRNAGGLNTTYFSGLGRQYNLGVRMEF
jgi:outer membrane receptor protein involved in Fe transport